MRPKLNGDDVAAFCSRVQAVSRRSVAGNVSSRTSRLIQPLLDLLKLSLELLVLQRQPAIGVLKQRLEVLDALVSRQQLSLGDPSFLLQSGILVNELQMPIYQCPGNVGNIDGYRPASGPTSAVPNCALRMPSSSAAPCCYCCG